MALPEVGVLHDRIYNAQLADVSADTSAWVPILRPGRLVGGSVAISAAITSANAVITVKKGSATLGTITIVQSGSAAGSVFTLAITGSEADCTLATGDVLELDSDGGSSTTSIGYFSLVVRGV